MMRRLLSFLLLLTLFVATPAFAQSTQTINTVPSNNATFLSDLQNFLREEDADRYMQMFVGMVVSGGTHATGAGLTKTPTALVAFPNGFYTTESGAITYTDNKTQWVIASSTTSGNLGTFTRVSGTHYLLDAVSGAKPSLPSGAVWLMEVTTAGGAVTVVTDLRTRMSYAGVYLTAELPAAGVRGRLAFVRDAGSGTMYFDNGTTWGSVGISNPMTTPGDIIIGGAAGAPTRQACGTSGTVLQGGATPTCTATPAVSTVTTSGQGAVQVGPYGAAAGNTGEIRVLELAANGSNYVAFKAADSIASNVVWTLPGADGASGQALITNGSGTLSFSAVAPLPRSYIAGYSISNNAGDPTNDIDVAVGAARDSTNADDITLAAAITKRLDANWSVGTNQGGLDTGAIANAWYAVWAIKRSDTGVVDVLFSTSFSAPTMPASYDRKRRIGAIQRAGGAIKLVSQVGNFFEWKSVQADVSLVNPGTAAVTHTISAPPAGADITAKIRVAQIDTGSALAGLHVFSMSANDEAASTANGLAVAPVANTAGSAEVFVLVTGGASQIRTRSASSSANTTLTISTIGYVDLRGSNN